MMITASTSLPEVPIQQRAAELLDWLIDFLPGATPRSAEDAILDVSEDVDALFYHRSELQKILEVSTKALTPAQKGKLAKLDRDIKAAAVLLVGAAKGMLRRCREGRYDRTHWWWYLEDILLEESLMYNQPKAPVQYALATDKRALSKVAEARAKYVTKPRRARK